MEEEIQVRLRQKGKWSSGDRKFILEKYIDGKLIETKTLPKPITLWNILRPPEKELKASQSTKETETKVPQKFPQSILTEQNKDTKKRTVTEEELRYLAKLTK